MILRNLYYDSRISGGGNGRCLKEDIPGFSLLRGDRLEPSAVLPDVGLFEEVPSGEDRKKASPGTGILSSTPAWVSALSDVSLSTYYTAYIWV